MRTEALMGAERVGHLRQRLAQIGGQQFLIGHVVRNLSQRVHVVGEADQLRFPAGERVQRVAHHLGAGHLAEGADVRQAGGAVAGFEQHRPVRGAALLALDALDEAPRFGERPGLGVLRRSADI